MSLILLSPPDHSLLSPPFFTHKSIAGLCFAKKATKDLVSDVRLPITKAKFSAAVGMRPVGAVVHPLPHLFLNFRILPSHQANSFYPPAQNPSYTQSEFPHLTRQILSIRHSKTSPIHQPKTSPTSSLNSITPKPILSPARIPSLQNPSHPPPSTSLIPQLPYSPYPSSGQSTNPMLSISSISFLCTGRTKLLEAL